MYGGRVLLPHGLLMQESTYYARIKALAFSYLTNFCGLMIELRYDLINFRCKYKYKKTINIYYEAKQAVVSPVLIFALNSNITAVTNLTINHSIKQSISQSISQSINQSIN